MGEASAHVLRLYDRRWQPERDILIEVDGGLTFDRAFHFVSSALNDYFSCSVGGECWTSLDADALAINRRWLCLTKRIGGWQASVSLRHTYLLIRLSGRRATVQAP